MIRTDLHSLNSLHTDQIAPVLTKQLRSVGELPVNLLKVAYTWQLRASQRRQLSELSDAQLRDMGISREAARREYSKSFWLP